MDDVVCAYVYRMVGRELAKRSMASGDDDVWAMIDLVVARLGEQGTRERQLSLGFELGPRGLGREEGVIRVVLEWAEREEWLPGVLAAKLKA